MPQEPRITITPAFASPIIQTSMPDCEALNGRLRELFLQWEQDTSRKRSSVPTPVIKVAVYESDFALFDNPEAEIQTLAQFCLQHTGYVIQQLNGYTTEEMRQLRLYHHSWYHLTRPGGYTAQHNHPMASWSGVYCVDAGDPVPEKANNGSLRMLESRTTASMYLDAGNAHWRAPFSFGELAFQLQAGQLLLFPSYLMHEVAPYYGQRERITVAFNVWVREAGEAAEEPSLRLRR
ncbi:MAG TPA: putative 2OG-Fe(II) oxygenase [Gammaproteobacteria bacterium]|nr:putative 2OG-Fe(II) oxygenase [Gammaproteobacteria bacterium]